MNDIELIPLGKLRLNDCFVSGSDCFCKLSYLNLALMFACLGKLIGRLHPQQRIGLYSEGLLETDRHIGGKRGIAVE